MYRKRKTKPANEDKENFNQAKCSICNGSGYVIVEKNGYTMFGCCTCEKGRLKMNATIIGRNSGSYKDLIKAGYKILNLEHKEDTSLNIEKIAYEAVKEEIPF